MAQRQIVQTAAGDLLHADRPVAAVLCACFAMQHADGHALLSGGDPLQRRALRHLRRRKCRAVDGAAVLGKSKAAHVRRGENMHILRPQDAGVG